MLQELVDSGRIKARTKWKTIYPKLSDDNRYLAMLGNPGSNPLELFWDVVDGLDQKLDTKIAVVEHAIRKNRLGSKESDGEDDSMNIEDKQPVIGPESTWDDFVALIKKDQDAAVKKLSDDNLTEIFDTVRGICNHNACNCADSKFTVA